MKKIIINLGKGSLRRGCDPVVVNCLNAEQKNYQQIIGSLPPAAELAELHRSWQSLYEAAYQNQAMRISLMRSGGVVRYSESEFERVCQELPLKLNEWLKSESFQIVERTLRTDLHPSEAIQIILNTEDERLRQLPWHLWNFLDDYHQAEISLSSANWREPNTIKCSSGKIRILAVLGNSEGINLKADIDALQSLPNKELVLLDRPTIDKLNEFLWQQAGWDILFFSGHSETKLEEGRIFLNAAESLTIDRLRNSLSRAIANGLKIAIFNSCEGVGLALKLAELNIPYTVVMREPVPDKIAQIFLKYLLDAFGEGKSFTLAVRSAREKLQGCEQEYFCASWLPLIWQNPAVRDLTWQDLVGNDRQGTSKPKRVKMGLPAPSLGKKSWSKAIILGSLLTSSLTIGLRSLGILESWELSAYDSLMRQRPAETVDPRILTIEITEADINRDRYPLQDKTLVELINNLEQHQPLAIGLDLHRAYPRGAEYPELIAKIDDNPNLFSVCSYGSQDISYAPPQGMSSEQLKYQMGFSDLPFDFPGSGRRLQTQSQDTNGLTVRRQILSYEPSLMNTLSQCLTPYSLSFRLAYQYLHQHAIEPLTVNQNLQWQLGRTEFTQLSPKFGGYQNLDGQSSQIILNYRASLPSQKITLEQLLASSSNLEALIKDRIILVGYSAPVARDESFTPYGKMPNVTIHAHMTSQIISAVLDGRSLIWTLPQKHNVQWGDWLWVFCCSALGSSIILITSRKHFIYGILSALALLLLLHQIHLLLLTQGGWLPYIPAIISISATASTIVIYRRQTDLTPSI